MPADYTNLINTLISISVYFVLILYILFSIIIVRQFQLMSKVIVSGVNKYVYFFVLAHLLFAILVSLVLAFII